MRTFEFESFEESYPALLKALLEEGNNVSPRGMLTKEISPVGITIKNPRKKVISSKIRKPNYGFMVGELLWILQGSNNVEHIAHYNKQWSSFSDDNVTLNGAYGQRIFKWDGLFDIYEIDSVDDEGNAHPEISCEQIVMNQFELAYEQLKADPDSRQATIVLFNPVQDYRVTKDKPCTNLIRFMIRDNKLNMTVFMRSNDIIKGYFYDIFNFAMLQEIMAGKLGIEVGKYTHIADSLHLYESDFELAKSIIDSQEPSLYDNFNLLDARILQDSIDDELNKIFGIEATTRTMGDLIKLDKVEEILKSISNEYWRSLAALIATYNFRKEGRSQEELDTLKKYITNEFSRIETIQDWKPLNKK